jgi:tetrahydrodipicolinate N-succinyltransferase
VAEKLGYTGGNAAIEITAAQLKDLEAAFLSVGAEDQAEIVEILEGTTQSLVLAILETDADPATTAEVYLKLSLLSHRLGANAGLGIPLGDRCTLEAGLYVTGGSKVTLLDDQNNEVSVVKAAELAGKPDLLFRRNSQNGRIEVKTNKSAIELNEELHKHN